MKNNKIFIVFISIFLVLAVGCTNGIKNEGNKIVAEKQVNGTDKYELDNEIKDSKEVQNVKNILNNISWENAKVRYRGYYAKNKFINGSIKEILNYLSRAMFSKTLPGLYGDKGLC